MGYRLGEKERILYNAGKQAEKLKSECEKRKIERVKAKIPPEDVRIRRLEKRVKQQQRMITGLRGIK